ncbi:histidine phosphatase family protein, partial [Streptomyces beijiangensis]|nr:histidine phosphatase family protein [Streptomyces beijiangensis]
MILVSPDIGTASRDARFDGGAEPEEAAEALVRRARGLAGALPAADRQLCGPSPGCRTTAEALGLLARTEPALGDWDMGRWRGRRLDEVSAEE